MYLLGLFEDINNFLFSSVRDYLASQNYGCNPIVLYEDKTFGSYSYLEEVERINSLLKKYKPDLVIGHSLGAYTSLQTEFSGPYILIEPSVSIKDIFLTNIKQKKDAEIFYEDYERKIKLSREFCESILNVFSISEVLNRKLEYQIDIIGAGKGGYKIAEPYKSFLRYGDYRFIPDADHNFSNEKYHQEIFSLIKKRLGSKSGSF